MTLRTRLVLALVVLSTTGLAVFGVVTYSLYERSLSSQLDEDLSGTARGRGGQLIVTAEQYPIDPETCLPVGIDFSKFSSLSASVIVIILPLLANNKSITVSSAVLDCD